MLAVAALAILVRIAVQLATGFYAVPETWEHEEIARNILAGRGYVYDRNGTSWLAFATPLFPLVLAAGYALFGISAYVLAGVNLAFGALLAVVVALVGWRIGGRDVALLSGIGAAVHPGLIVYAAKAHPLALDAVLAAALVLAALVLADRGSARLALAFGLLAGVAALSRPTLLPFAVLAAMWAGVRWPPGLMFQRAALAGLAALAVVAPWVIRNAVTVPYVGLSTSFGEVLWIGNNPAASGTALSHDRLPMLEAAPAIRQRTFGRGEVEQDMIFRGEAMAFITEDPARAIALDVRKFISFWSFGATTGTYYPPVWSVAYGVFYAVLAAAAAAGLVMMFRSDPRPTVLMVLLFVSLSVSQSMFFVEGRHRWEVEALLFVPAAVAVTTAPKRWSHLR